MNAQAVIAQITAWIAQAVHVVLLLLIAATVAQKLGARIPMLPALDHVTLAYLAGAYWLWRK